MRILGFRLHPTDEELAEYVSGHLSPPRRSMIDRHAAECQRCQAKLVDEMEVASAMEDPRGAP